MKLSSVFTDHAVLQRGISVPVWGTTKPGLNVRATLAGLSARTTASASGFFTLRFSPLPAGGPYTLKITTNDKTESASLKDVLVGEVWVCSGQSNMEFAVQTGLPDPEPTDCNGIRMITVPRLAQMGRQTSFDAEWKVGNLDNVPGFSAVGYFFARRLHAELGVPVGMIHTSWGGTRAEAWTSREGMMRLQVTEQMVNEYEASLASEDYWSNSGCPSAVPLDPGNAGVKKGWASPDFDDGAWRTTQLPGTFEQCLGTRTNGSFWFRKTLTLPAAWVGKKLTLHVGTADKHDVSYFNGVKVGAMGSGTEEQFWCSLRKYPVPAKAVNGTKAVVAVRVWSHLFDGGLRGPETEMYVELAGDPTKRIKLSGDWKFAAENDIGLSVPPPAMPYLPGNQNSPYTLFDSMINPLLPYAIRGAIWYQGESNERNAQDYLALQCNMIDDWRRAWGQGDFPFICVQLANFRMAKAYDEASAWASLREAQLLSTQKFPNTGMASAIDIGDATDIHPKNKRDVGFRLAQWALAKTYGRAIAANGPHYAGYALEGDSIRIRFTDVGKKLVIRGAKGKIKTCFIADDSRKFVPAEATVEGDTLLVHSDAVKRPAAVRYAWADNPEGCNLYNADGLPASPFRTDVW